MEKTVQQDKDLEIKVAWNSDYTMLKSHSLKLEKSLQRMHALK